MEVCWALLVTISTYDLEGNRIGTIYEGRDPQYVKEKFLPLIDTEFEGAPFEKMPL